MVRRDVPTPSHFVFEVVFEHLRDASESICLSQFKRRQLALVTCRQQDFVTAAVRDSMRASVVQIRLRDCASKSSASTYLVGKLTASASQSRSACVEGLRQKLTARGLKIFTPLFARSRISEVGRESSYQKARAHVRWVNNTE
jgi:hypothetical protein